MEIHTQQSTSPGTSVLWQNKNEGEETVLDGRGQHQTEPVDLLPLCNDGWRPWPSDAASSLRKTFLSSSGDTLLAAILIPLQTNNLLHPASTLHTLRRLILRPWEEAAPIKVRTIIARSSPADAIFLSGTAEMTAILGKI